MELPTDRSAFALQPFFAGPRCDITDAGYDRDSVVGRLPASGQAEGC